MVLPSPAFLHEQFGRTLCLHRRRTRCRRSHLLSIVASACNVSYLGTKLGSACTHVSCAACCSRPRCRATALIVQCSTGGASPNQKSSYSSDDPTCTSRKMLVSGRYEIDGVKRWRLSYMTRLFDVSFSRKVQESPITCHNDEDKKCPYTHIHLNPCTCHHIKSARMSSLLHLI